MKLGYGFYPASGYLQNVHSMELLALSVLNFLGLVLWPRGRCGWGESVSTMIVTLFLSMNVHL